MHGISGESSRAARAGGGQRGRRWHPAVIAAAVAMLAAIGVAGCQGHASTSAAGDGAGSLAASGPAHSSAASGAAHSSAAAPVPLAWSAARAPLPPDATGVSGQYTVLTDVSCPDVGDCVAVGGYRAGGAGGDVYQALIETLSAGTWTPVGVPDVSSKKNFAALDAVSCPARGSCVAVGFFTAAAGVFTPVIEMLSGGRLEPVKPPRPADADTTAAATLNVIACPAAGTCVATGWYITGSGVRDGYVDTLANGTWTAASVPLPPDAAPEQSSSPVSTYLASVACPQAGSCVAAGQYLNDSGQVEPFIATLSGGTWTAAKAALPADAAATGQNGSLWAIACPASGACIAGGHYLVRGGQPRYLAETQSGGAWTASVLPLPAGAAADQKWSQDVTTTIGALACESVGACVATAGYVTKANEILPVIETLSGGTWTVATAPLPADAAPGSGPANATYLQLATCPAAGHCVTVGSYPATDGTVGGLIETAVPR
jgi:hypothetical protein